MTNIASDTKAVVIGRNEGERLICCLTSLHNQLNGTYVDSGSDDGSQAFAASVGFNVVELDVREGFTAAKARNAGVASLAYNSSDLKFVQMIDGDCRIAAEWLAVARSILLDQPEVAVVFGRRRELHPHRNVYHRVTDDEWNVQTGFVDSCGGDALFRLRAFQEVGGYDDSLIAGEEPDLCYRLRQAGWKVLSIGEHMTSHDVDMTSLKQWWLRAKRAGYGITMLVRKHGTAASESWNRLLLSAYIWSIVALTSAFTLTLGLSFDSTPLLLTGLLTALLIVCQIIRLSIQRRSRVSHSRDAVLWSCLLLVSKFAQVSGSLSCLIHGINRKKANLIEYK